MEQVSGGYLYNRYLVEQLRSAGFDVTYHAHAGVIERAGASDVLIVDSLVLPQIAARLLAVPAQLVLLLHVVPDPRPLGTSGERLLAALYRRSRVVVTGNSTLTALRDDLALTGIDAVMIEPGVPEHWRMKERYADCARRLLGVANYLPGKGIGRLIDVLEPLRELPWQLTVRGNNELDPECYRGMRRVVIERGLADRIALLGPVPHATVNDEMVDADLLVHFSVHESYSMVTAEAIACGLPVLSYRTGDVEAFARSGLVRHVDDRAEARELAALIAHADHYGRLRRRGARTLRTWRHVGREFIDWLEA